jgi:threonine efflux protein
VTEGAALVAFAGVIAVGQFSPGPDFLLVTRTALAHGGRAGSWTAVGIACGLTLHAAVAMGGVSVLLMGDSLLPRGLRLAAGLYLAWLAYQLLRAAWHAASPAAPGQAGPPPGGDGGTCWRRGLFCNLFNPKVALFFAAVSAPFLTHERPPWWPWALGGLIVAQGLLLWVAWAWALQWGPLKRVYQRAGRWIDGLFGLLLLVLAARVVAGSV